MCLMGSNLMTKSEERRDFFSPKKYRRHYPFKERRKALQPVEGKGLVSMATAMWVPIDLAQSGRRRRCFSNSALLSAAIYFQEPRSRPFEGATPPLSPDMLPLFSIRLALCLACSASFPQISVCRVEAKK